MIDPSTGHAPPIWAPTVNGPALPNTARVRDYWLGGSHHGSADRRMAEQFTLCAPHLPHLVRTHRTFLRRAVTHLVRAGVRQFLDLGSGMPTVGQVHEVAGPGCRVVYVDLDPIVVAESCRLLAGVEGVAYARADLCRPEQVLATREVRELLDPAQPVAVLAVDVLHFVPDSDDPAGVLDAYAEAFGPGTHVVVSHNCADQRMADAIRLFSDIYSHPLPPFEFRSPEELAALLRGFEIAEPGVVPVPLWRPDSHEDDDEPDRNPEHFGACAALAHRP